MILKPPTANEHAKCDVKIQKPFKTVANQMQIRIQSHDAEGYQSKPHDSDGRARAFAFVLILDQ